MYRQLKLTKRLSVSLSNFRKTSKNTHKAYSNGFYKNTDNINEFDMYFFILGLYRVIITIKHKNPTGCCSS